MGHVILYLGFTDWMHLFAAVHEKVCGGIQPAVADIPAGYRKWLVYAQTLAGAADELHFFLWSRFIFTRQKIADYGAKKKQHNANGHTCFFDNRCFFLFHMQFL